MIRKIAWAIGVLVVAPFVVLTTVGLAMAGGMQGFVLATGFLFLVGVAALAVWLWWKWTVFKFRVEHTVFTQPQPTRSTHR